MTTPLLHPGTLGYLLRWCLLATLLVSASVSQAETQHHKGLFDLWWDTEQGKVHMAIPEFDKEYLYLVSLPNGLGSNDIGLDRGKLGTEYVVTFKRVGPKVLMMASNTQYRANSENPAEARAVEEAFAASVLARFDIVPRKHNTPVVDITPLLLSDAYAIAPRLAERGQGNFSFAADLSAAIGSSLRSFEKNALAEAWLTFTSSKPGDEVTSVTPDPTKATVKVRHHFVALPEQPLARREFHPQSGYFYVPYRDYAASLDAPIEQRLLVRHRLEKKDPSQAQSEAVEPLVYYVDAGAPEPIRSALIEGAQWWNDAFTAAGFNNAFRVEVLPEDADPLDLRYNTIQWVHRSTRGWSYGASIVDPRSGEILKGHVSLGSLRVRQDMLIAQALTSPFGPDGDKGEAAQQMALARLRQLSAHEVGHTLGLAHNFFTSAKDDASVMDYPHPNLRLNDGKVDLSQAYASGIGEWDKLAITYGYAQNADAEKLAETLQNTLLQADSLGLRFITDADVRGPATAHAGAHLWDNGADPIQAFENLLQVRQAGLKQFSRYAIRPNQPLGDLETTLVPLYLLHRYQAEAVAKQIGGVDFDYALNNPSDKAKVIPRLTQKSALQVLIASLSPQQLTLPNSVVETLLPPAYGYQRTRESFEHRTANSFDQLAPARAATQLIVGMILEPGRAQRLWQQTLQDSAQLSLKDALYDLSEQLIAPINSASSGKVAIETAWITLREMQRLAVSTKVSDPVRAQTLMALNQLSQSLSRSGNAREMAKTLKAFLEQPSEALIPAPVVVPPGSPI
ncbi:zinc-dependent metalloprotease [Halioxenophilus aromaticivorans]|uniref:Zinc-dependent metalloprotease n=1 Tax=Halioxenophilus aromaticivorans TaxID=1306992 RepID=A0AAV3U7D4_9ALTE